VVMLGEPSKDVWDGALQVGVRGLATPDTSDEELRSMLLAAIDTATRRGAILAAAVVPPVRRSRVVVVVSPKGGSGKTTVSTNVSVALARTAQNHTVLVDLDLQFGDVASALQLTPAVTIADATGAPIDATQAASVISLLSHEFPVVVVDTPAGLDEYTLAALEIATDIVFVSTMDVSSIRSLRKEVDALNRLGLDRAERHFVLNRADARVGLEAADVEAVLGMSVDVAIPSTRAVPVAVNQGVALVESDPRAPVARQFERLASRFLPRESGADSKSRLRRKRGTS
jgi:pilus assembly protein CpaE